MVRSRAWEKLAQRAGLVDVPGLERLVAELRDRVRAGRPTSLGALLVERGIGADKVLALAAAGAVCSAMRCDACSSAIPFGTVQVGRELSCPRCSSRVVSFGEAAAAASKGPGAVHQMPGGGVAIAVPAMPDGPANDDDTEPLPIRALRSVPVAVPMVPPPPAGFQSEMPTPPIGFQSEGTTEDGEGAELTMRFDGVLAIPKAPSAKPFAPMTPPASAAAQRALLEDDERTLNFKHVIPLPPVGSPGSGVPVFPVMTPGKPPSMPADPESGTAAFNEVMPLPAPQLGFGFSPLGGAPQEMSAPVAANPVAAPFPAPFPAAPMPVPLGDPFASVPLAPALPTPGGIPGAGADLSTTADDPDPAGTKASSAKASPNPAGAAEPERKKPLVARKRPTAAVPSSSAARSPLFFVAIGSVVAIVLVGVLFALGAFDSPKAKPGEPADGTANATNK